MKHWTHAVSTLKNTHRIKTVRGILRSDFQNYGCWLFKCEIGSAPVEDSDVTKNEDLRREVVT